MTFVRQGKGRASRRDVLKGGAALGLAGAGFASGMAPWVARAATTKVTVISAGGSFSLVQALLFKELKLFEKYDVDATIVTVSDGNKILAGLISGDGDICGGSGFSGLFPAIEKGAKVKILGGAGIFPQNILYSNKPDIKSVKDLPGRTVGTGAIGALLHQLSVAVMMKYGVDYKKVNFVNVGSSQDVFKALAGGAIDAGVAPVEFRDTAAKYKLHPITDGQFYKELPLWVNQAMYAADRAVADKRQGLVGVMAAYADSFRWITNQANKQAFIDAYRRTIPSASPEEASFFQDFLSLPGSLATNPVLSTEQLKFTQDLNVELGQQKAVLPFEAVADMSLAREVEKMVKG